jgi:SecD/SecF fusion protein
MVGCFSCSPRSRSYPPYALSARRRNLFILLLVAGLFAGSIAVIATKETKLGLDLRGGVELVYQAKPTPQQPVVTQDSLDRAIDVMRDRVDALGVSEPEIQRSGENQISVGLPDVENADEAQQQVGQVAQLYFYDWEPNVIGPDGKPAPQDPSVTGGPAAGSPTAALTQYDALQRAAKRPPVNDDNNTHGGQYWAVEEKDKEVLAGPADTEADLQEDLDQLLEDKKIDATERKNAKTVKIEPGTVIVRAEQPDDIRDDQKGNEWFVLADNAVLRGTDIRNPEQSFDQQAGGAQGGPNVTFEFSDRGKRIWKQVTKEIAQRGASQALPGPDQSAARQHFAAVLDDEIISAPYIDFEENPSGIDASQGSQISGGFTIKSAQRLANQLKTGALPVRLELISQSQVSATLGQQSLDQGLLAGAIGFSIVALFLLIFYRVLGVIAVTALIVYSVYLFALIKLIPITLTLPGIAGLILTIGVAADANIVIFERVKEEIRAGRSVTAGLAAGYRKGIGAIIDANVVTIMVAFILFVLATAGVRGFAFTLGVGTITSLFTAVLFTQAIVGTLGTSKALARPSALGAGGEPRAIRFDFMGKSKYFFSASGVILLICALAIGGKGINLGIDFESGTRIRAAVEKPADENAIRDLVADQGYTAEVQKVDEPELGKNVFQISTENLRPAQVTKVTAAIDERYAIQGEPNTQSIGPTFGESVAKSAIIAVIASLLVISVYLALRFEWKYAVPVLIALAHDLLITAGVYALIGQEVTTGTVAALLTILGFSLYDTIIVFDRIRENVPRMPRATFSQVVNRSMSEVIIRSLATSFTAALPVFALMVFGGETLRDFAMALFVGTLSGTYSSVFIASQVLVHWKEREPVYVRRRAIVAAEHGGVIPPYATGKGGQPVDIEPTRRRTRGGLSQDAPTEVSKAEFDEMVRDLHADKPKQGTAVEDPLPPTPAAPAPDDSADASPDELYMKDDPRKKRPRNKRHGRNR